jgi:hypothetical protein
LRISPTQERKGPGRVSLSTMGCWEEGAGSRILRRRCPNAIKPCAKRPAASGPRECIDCAAFESSASETSPLVLTSPQNPHMLSFRAPLPLLGAGYNPLQSRAFLFSFWRSRFQ